MSFNKPEVPVLTLCKENGSTDSAIVIRLQNGDRILSAALKSDRSVVLNLLQLSSHAIVTVMLGQISLTIFFATTFNKLCYIEIYYPFKKKGRSQL